MQHEFPYLFPSQRLFAVQLAAARPEQNTCYVGELLKIREVRICAWTDPDIQTYYYTTYYRRRAGSPIRVSTFHIYVFLNLSLHNQTLLLRT